MWIVEEFYEMIFLRLLGVVECVWYEVLWEKIEDKVERICKINEEWILFLVVLIKEFMRLDKMGVMYRLFFLGVR